MVVSKSYFIVTNVFSLFPYIIVSLVILYILVRFNIHNKYSFELGFNTFIINNPYLFVKNKIEITKFVVFNYNISTNIKFITIMFIFTPLLIFIFLTSNVVAEQDLLLCICEWQDC